MSRLTPSCSSGSTKVSEGEGKTAVDGHVRPGDPGAGLAGEPHQRRGHLLRLEQPLERLLAREVLGVGESVEPGALLEHWRARRPG